MWSPGPCPTSVPDGNISSCRWEIRCTRFRCRRKSKRRSKRKRCYPERSEGAQKNDPSPIPPSWTRNNLEFLVFHHEKNQDDSYHCEHAEGRFRSFPFLQLLHQKLFAAAPKDPGET